MTKEKVYCLNCDFRFDTSDAETARCPKCGSLETRLVKVCPHCGILATGMNANPDECLKK